MKVLLICGTGCIGSALSEKLIARGDEVYITSRSFRTDDRENVQYLKGDFWDELFLSSVLSSRHYDCIVDFGHYDAGMFERWMPMLLLATDHYFYLSSSRVYAGSSDTITEESLRLIDSPDVIRESAGYIKGCCENLLRRSDFRNWTIIRPYITYNTNRLQLGIYEKEYWLRCLLENKPLIIPGRLLSCTTTLTFAEDTADVISRLMGNDKAKRDVYQIATGEHHTWREIALLYCDILRNEYGLDPQIYETKYDSYIPYFFDEVQYINDRLYDRVFDSKKVEETTGFKEWTPLRSGIEKVLNNFISCEKYFAIDQNDFLRWDVYIQKYIRENKPSLLSDKSIDYENNPKESVILVGAGNRCSQNISKIREYFDVKGIADNDTGKYDLLIDGVRINSIDYYADGSKDVQWVITVDDARAAFQLMDQCRSAGINNIGYLKNLVRGLR